MKKKLVLGVFLLLLTCASAHAQRYDNRNPLDRQLDYVQDMTRSLFRRAHDARTDGPPDWVELDYPGYQPRWRSRQEHWRRSQQSHQSQYYDDRSYYQGYHNNFGGDGLDIGAVLNGNHGSMTGRQKIAFVIGSTITGASVGEAVGGKRGRWAGLGIGLGASLMYTSTRPSPPKIIIQVQDARRPEDYQEPRQQRRSNPRYDPAPQEPSSACRYFHNNTQYVVHIKHLENGQEKEIGKLSPGNYFPMVRNPSGYVLCIYPNGQGRQISLPVKIAGCL